MSPLGACPRPRPPPPPIPRPLTIVAVPDAVLQDRLPLVLLGFRHHAEVVVPGGRVPEDERELRGALEDGGGA